MSYSREYPEKVRSLKSSGNLNDGIAAMSLFEAGIIDKGYDFTPIYQQFRTMIHAVIPYNPRNEIIVICFDEN